MKKYKPEFKVEINPALSGHLTETLKDFYAANLDLSSLKGPEKEHALNKALEEYGHNFHKTDREVAIALIKTLMANCYRIGR